MKKTGLCTVLGFIGSILFGQDGYWQQRVEYDIEVDFNVQTNQYSGQQAIKYFNNSPDTLQRIFVHLYLNAFQPNSMMDIKSRTIPDPSIKVMDRIYHLTKEEEGWIHVLSVQQNGQQLHLNEQETILEIQLQKQLLPGKSTTLSMNFEAQIPLQVRRNGRDNVEGVRYSMAQWYPKICEYDRDGWHPDDYIAREFYGVWGDYDVKIDIDTAYVVPATGKLISKSQSSQSEKTRWHYKAQNVHDFAWAADPDYIKEEVITDDGTALYFYHKDNPVINANWTMLPALLNKCWPYINKTFGDYPYDSYSFVQGGDGGMEYPMLTLINGVRTFESLVGVCLHELMHSWYQGLMATNENLYAWMDEGFTEYAEIRTKQYLQNQEIMSFKELKNGTFESYHQTYYDFIKREQEESLATQGDHFEINEAYSRASYTKGLLFLSQLAYVIGEEALDRTLKRYYHEWKFKHPRPLDFIRVAEKESDMVLDWYYEFMVNEVKHIDYEAIYVVNNEEESTIYLSNKGSMALPVDIEVTFDDNSKEYMTIPLQMMRGAKHERNMTVLKPWQWTHPYYIVSVSRGGKRIAKVSIDPEHRTLDINRLNNTWHE